MNLNNFALITADSISLAAIIGTLAGVLPPLAALGAVIWYGVQIWESKTVQAWVARGKYNQNAKPPEQ